MRINLFNQAYSAHETVVVCFQGKIYYIIFTLNWHFTTTYKKVTYKNLWFLPVFLL